MPTLQLYVWEEFMPDWTGGLAVAIASSEEEARAQVILQQGGYPPSDWGLLSIHPINTPIAFAVSGGS